MNQPSGGAERRKFSRVPLIVDCYYKVERPPEIKMKVGDRTETAYLMDMSEGGIGFISGIELPEGTELDITFNLVIKDAANPKIQAVGIVRYCTPQPDSRTYRIGLEFTKMEAGEKELIAQYVKNIPKG
jgi:c-di-GMP-binding flagellar brake protein YcgR